MEVCGRGVFIGFDRVRTPDRAIISNSKQQRRHTMFSYIATAIGGGIIGGLIVRKNQNGSNALVAWVKAKIFKKTSTTTTSDTTASTK
jgi:hypothetical protein